MARKLFPDKELADNEYLDIQTDFKPESPGLKEKVSGGFQYVLGVLKFLLGISLLPFVYSASVAFLNQLRSIDHSFQTDFWAGVITLLLVHLFLWEPAFVYARGQKMLGTAFNFFKPLVKVAPSLLPVYTIIVFIVYGIVSLMNKSEWPPRYALFLAGFSSALHLVYSARSVRSRKSDFLKANYIFSFSFIYVTNLVLLSFFLSLGFKAFSFPQFFNSGFQEARQIFEAVFRQIFL